MGKFLDSFLTTMPNIQRESLREILEMDSHEFTVYEREVVRNQIESLIARVSEESKFSFSARPQHEKSDSKAHNQNMEEIAFDLRVLFKLSNIIDQYMGNHLRLTQAEMQSIQKSVYNLRKELDKIKLLLKKGDHISEYIHEDFKVPEWAEVDKAVLKPLLKDRSSNELHESYMAEVNDEGLTLATEMLMDQLTTSYGRVMGSVKVNRITTTNSEVKNHGIEQAIDSSLETYWMDHIMADAPIEGQHGYSLITGENYEQVGGAIVEVEIQLDHLVSLSDIALHPFTNYPLEIYAIYGWSNRDYAGERYTLVGPSERRSSTDKMVFQFPTVTVGSIVIVLRQINYTKESYLVSVEDLNNQELWEQLSEQQIQQFVEGLEDIDTLNASNQITGFHLYQAAMEKYVAGLLDDTASKDFHKILESIRKGLNPGYATITFDRTVNGGKTEKTFQEVKKYSYIIGAYHIALNSREYKESSIYVTKSLPISVNANRLTLETVEQHSERYNESTFSDTVETSIEYYVTTSKNPKMNDWYSLCPLGVTRIDSERLLGDFLPERMSGFTTSVYQVHSLRFPALSNTEIVLRRNGKVLPKHAFALSTDRHKLGIKEEYFSPGSIYTVSYVPSHEGYYVDLSNLPNAEPTQYTNAQGEAGERFTNVAPGNVLTLSYTPFVKRSYILKEDRKTKEVGQVENILKTAALDLPLHIWADDVRLQDVTDYASATYDPEKLKENNGYTFACVNNKIYLGTPNDKSIYEQVTVDYRYILMNIRMKAILRRNTNDDNSITPVLEKYTLRVETKDLEGQA